MKNFIYLSILASLIVLSSCKGNSFMSRKYTHFSRGHKNVTVKEGLVLDHKKMQPTVMAPVKTENTGPVTADASSSEVIYNRTNAGKNQQTTRSAQKFQALPVNNSSNALTNTNDLNSPNLFVHQKVKTQSKHTFKAIIGELIGLVIWIIMVCVLVAAILLLIVLL